MEALTVEGRITALAPIFTGGDEKTGVEILLRRMRFRVGEKFMEVPILSGNSIRGVLRRLLLQDFFDRVGYEIKSLRLYHMFAGGALEEVAQSETGRLDIGLRRMIRAYLPPLSLFGGALGNQVFQGKLIVGKALPVCRELNDYLPVQSKLSVYTFLTYTFGTRRAEREPPETVQPKPAKGKADGEPTIQMLYNMEVFVPGTVFYHKFQLLDCTPVEKSCFAWMLDLWRQRPFIGGRVSAGFGEVKLEYQHSFSADEYLSFLQERREEVVKTLAKLDQL